MDETMKIRGLAIGLDKVDLDEAETAEFLDFVRRHDERKANRTDRYQRSVRPLKPRVIGAPVYHA